MAIQSTILSATFLARGTATSLALDLVRSSVLTPSAGHRGGRTVVVLITTGPSQEDTSVVLAASDALHAVAEVIVIGLGEEASQESLGMLPSSASALYLLDWASSEGTQQPIVEDVAARQCMHSTTTTSTTTTTTTLCPPVDLVFVLDSSVSLGEANWRLALAFASSIVDLLTIGERDTRYACCRDVAF